MPQLLLMKTRRRCLKSFLMRLLREDLFNYAVNSDWVILKMTPTTTDLEDVFRKLTMEGKADA